MSEQKILMVVAPEGFRDEEYSNPKDIFEENGIKVITCSKNVEVAVGKFGQEVDVDIDLSEVNSADYDAVVFVGGPGALDYLEDQNALELIQQFANDSSKIIGAICIAPMVLLAAGVLKGKNATVWNKDKKQSEAFLESGVVFVDEPVVDDGNIVTACGPEAALLFAETIIEKLEELST